MRDAAVVGAVRIPPGQSLVTGKLSNGSRVSASSVPQIALFEIPCAPKDFRVLAEPSGRLVASYSLFAAGIAMLILSLTLSDSFGTGRNDRATLAADSSSQLPFLPPALLGKSVRLRRRDSHQPIRQSGKLVWGGCALLAALGLRRW
jgi:hypothetical protein